MKDKLIIRGASEHNLKHIDLDLDKNSLIVISGLSGSGKSSLAFDTIFAEGQRRYVESLSSYARMFLGRLDKPEVELIEGLSPAISIEQKTTGHNPRSTVGTITEIYDYYRLVRRYRWAGVLISGAYGGLGGICYILAGVSEWRFEYGAAGFGFLALAVMIFGQWKPHRIALAGLLFGFFRALSNVYFGFPFLVSLNIPGNIYNMMPYIISLIVLALTSSRSRAPKAEGIPYDKGQR